jgi:hypothetical protein
MKSKQEIITFKVDAALAEAMRGMPNRSEFLRSAVLAALQNICPLCKGTGILSPHQMAHWSAFAKTHSIEECEKCHEFHLVCASEKPEHCRYQKAK